MSRKEISVKKYVVRLSAEEREQLETLIGKGKSAARRQLKARILLKADVSPDGAGWSDGRIIGDRVPRRGVGAYRSVRRFRIKAGSIRQPRRATR